ncbi:hypothetical protein L210DRAFT_3562169 [Boletus edulis BED1]|uniref:Uncharacterized protein n=1 Tax=Boletus edulis BED1 TaxID=1328754 RepID=A0AAD4BHF3_BOLED|nr:hypothetical protein L210DRAFT_3562169 [Boletus edulis BED1]
MIVSPSLSGSSLRTARCISFAHASSSLDCHSTRTLRLAPRIARATHLSDKSSSMKVWERLSLSPVYAKPSVVTRSPTTKP